VMWFNNNASIVDSDSLKNMGDSYD